MIFPVDEYDLTLPLRPFALEHAGKNNVSQGLATGAGSFVTRHYRSSAYADPAVLDYEERLLLSLSRRRLSFALPVPRATRQGTRHVGAGRDRAALIPFLPGTPLARLPLDGALLGAAIGELQIAMRDEPPIVRPGNALFTDLFAFPTTQGQPSQPNLGDLSAPETAEGSELLRWWDAECSALWEFVETTYRALPMQLCHNDVTPNNILVVDGRVTAILDFEFATVTARALDFSTGLRLVIRHWLPGQAWTAVEPFCRSYARWVTLTNAEIATLPMLLQLRGAITVLWWLGSASGLERATRVLDSIANLRRLHDWLATNERALIDCIGPLLR